MEKLFWIAIGGAIGSVCRFLLASWGNQLSPSLPWGTLVVNVLGCCAVGGLGATFLAHPGVKEVYRLGLITGVLGGFTTFSAFGWETISLVQAGRVIPALLYVLLSNACGLLAVLVGFRLVSR